MAEALDRISEDRRAVSASCPHFLYMKSARVVPIYASTRPRTPNAPMGHGLIMAVEGAEGSDMRNVAREEGAEAFRTEVAIKDNPLEAGTSAHRQLSDDNKVAIGYTPVSRPTKLTLDDIQKFKELFEDSNLKWWIMAAGIGGLAELAHVSWLVFVYAAGRFHP